MAREDDFNGQMRHWCRCARCGKDKLTCWRSTVPSAAAVGRLQIKELSRHPDSGGSLPPVDASDNEPTLWRRGREADEGESERDSLAASGCCGEWPAPSATRVSCAGNAPPRRTHRPRPPMDAHKAADKGSRCKCANTPDKSSCHTALMPAKQTDY